MQAQDQLSTFGRFYRRSGLRNAVQRRRDAMFYHMARAALAAPRSMSLPAALELADRLGNLMYSAVPSLRRLALQHVAIAFGDTLSAAAREEIARGAYRSAARCFVEVAKVETIRPRFEEYASVDGWEYIEEAKALNRGGIVVTGHIGNWELLAAYFTRKGLPIAAVARRINDPRLNQLLVDFRTSNGLEVILRNSPTSSAQIRRVLKQRRAFALQIDQDIRVQSVTVPFFGRPARTPAAPAILAVRRDIPIVVACAQRRPEGGHHFIVKPPIYPPKTGDKLHDIIEMTRRSSLMLEDHIRANPTEWNWWHRRWRRPPVPNYDLDGGSSPPGSAYDQ
jgi:KDO2-lipid IV(A) lauroyltransferase